MSASQSPRARLRKLAFSIGFVGSGVFLAPTLLISPAQAGYFERTPGTFECRNSLDPQCGRPPRETTGNWRCRNNPGPECAEPPRIEGALSPERGSWECRKNQNVVACGNPVRFSVDDPEAWPSFFPSSQ